MSADAVHEKIADMIGKNRIVLFMKGDRQQPMCGFSAQVIHILNSYHQEYVTLNVLDDWELREGIKAYTNWPTIPQLYVDQKFIGGCDITMEMHRKGELKDILVKEAS
jgi:monothiol glutaredoxin